MSILLRRWGLVAVAMASAVVAGEPARAQPLPQPATRPSVPATVATVPVLDFGTTGLDIPALQRVNATTPRTVQLIGEAMRREGGARALRLARELGTCGSREALTYLGPMLSDPDPRMRAQCARSVGMIGDPAILPSLQPLLADTDPSVRREAVMACAGLGDDRAVATGLADADVSVFCAAIRVAQPHHAAAAAQRVDQLPPRVVMQVLRRLGEWGSRAHIPLLTQYLHAGADTGCRVAAIEALERLAAMDQGPIVLGMLQDDHPVIRRAATHAITTLVATKEQAARTIPMLSDPDPSVREAAVKVLIRSPTAVAVPLLVQQLDDGYEPLRVAARNALIAAGGDAIPAASSMLSSADPQRQIDGSYVLGHLRNGASLERHHALLGSSDWQVVAQAAWSLGQIERPESEGPIVALVQRIPAMSQSLRRDEYVPFGDAASEAVIAAVRLRCQAALPTMIQLMQARMAWPRLRAACIWGFGVLGDASDPRRCELLLSIVNDPDETNAPKLEALKALGHLRFAPVGPELLRMAQTHGDAQLRWMAHWSYERSTGQDIPYLPPSQSDSAITTVVDLTP